MRYTKAMIRKMIDAQKTTTPATKEDLAELKAAIDSMTKLLEKILEEVTPVKWTGGPR